MTAPTTAKTAGGAASTSWPAISNVTAVGGTALDPGFDANGDATAYVSETVWNDSAGASGGGASTLVAKPTYQSAPGVPTDGARDQPDVSLLASPSNPGYVVVLESDVVVFGGTSASAPSWAGIVALLNDALHVDGSGPLNATLYALGRQQYAENGAAVFHDITQGNTNFNGVIGYAAGPGYDLATGLGTPDVAVLAQALGCDHQHSHPNDHSDLHGDEDTNGPAHRDENADASRRHTYALPDPHCN